MPRMDDPTIKIKEIKAYKRKSLRPWDDSDEFKPTSSTTPEDLTTVNYIENNKETIRKQLGNNKETHKEQIETISKHIVNIKETIGEPIREQITPTNSKQLVNQLVNNNSEKNSVLEKINRLCGLQRKLLIYIVENCKSRGLLHTTTITNETLRQLLNTDPDSVKTTVQRLINKFFICRERGKRGKGGFSIFTITELVRNGIIESERQLNIGNQLGNQLVNAISKQLENNWQTNKETTLSSSSSSIDNINITTTTEIPDNWLDIDLEEGKNFGFTKNHLIQLYKQGDLDPQMVQDSIEHFAFDLEHNGKAKEIKTNPLSYFMGIVRRVGVYNAPENYESPKAKALRMYLEKKKTEQKQRAAIEKEFLNNAFQEWQDGISEEEKNKIIPEDVKRMNIKAPRIAALRSYFEKIIWQVKKDEILKAATNEE